MKLGQGWPYRAESQQQGQGVGAREQRGRRLFVRGQDDGWGWAEAGEQSAAGGALNAVVHTEQCSLECGACLPGACLDSSQEASEQFHPSTIVLLHGFPAC